MVFKEQFRKKKGDVLFADDINQLEENIADLDTRDISTPATPREEIIAMTYTPTSNAVMFGLKQVVDTTGFTITHIAAVTAPLDSSYDISLRMNAVRTAADGAVSMAENVVSEDFTLSGSKLSHSISNLPTPVSNLKQELLYIGIGALEIYTDYYPGSNNNTGISVIIKGIRNVQTA